VNGKRQLIALEIDPAIVKADDKIVLQDLVIDAVNKAMDEVEVLAREELRRKTEGLLPNIPGLDLGGMMGWTLCISRILWRRFYISLTTTIVQTCLKRD